MSSSGPTKKKPRVTAAAKKSEFCDECKGLKVERLKECHGCPRKACKTCLQKYFKSCQDCDELYCMSCFQNANHWKECGNKKECCNCNEWKDETEVNECPGCEKDFCDDCAPITCLTCERRGSGMSTIHFVMTGQRRRREDSKPSKFCSEDCFARKGGQQCLMCEDTVCGRCIEQRDGPFYKTCEGGCFDGHGCVDKCWTPCSRCDGNYCSMCCPCNDDE